MIIGAALVLLDARVYEAAEVMGASPSRQFRDLTLPAARFGILNAAFVCFTITITDFGNAAVIGGDYSVLATEIYSQVVGQRNFNMGAVVGIMLLLPSDRYCADYVAVALLQSVHGPVRLNRASCNSTRSF